MGTSAQAQAFKRRLEQGTPTPGDLAIIERARVVKEGLTSGVPVNEIAARVGAKTKLLRQWMRKSVGAVAFEYLEREATGDEETIAERVQSLGREITTAYPDGDLLVLGLLKGSFIFLSDLVRRIDRPLQVDFIVASSYGEGTVSSGNVRLVYDPETELAGRHILLVEDIIDTGKTLNKLVALLKQRRPRSLEICALLHKQDRKSTRLNSSHIQKSRMPSSA